MAIHGSQYQWRISVRINCVWVCVVGQQQLHNIKMTIMCCDRDRSTPIAVCHVHICISIQQQLCHVDITIFSCKYQRCLFKGISSLNVGALV